MKKFRGPKMSRNSAVTFVRFLNVAGLNGDVDFARETTAQADQTVGMRRQQFLVDARPIMKSVEMRRRNQLHQIAIAGLVFRQQGEMVGWRRA